MPLASVAGNELHYRQRGEGEPLLLIMGMSGSHLHWGEPFLNALDQHLSTTSFDHRGIGSSTRLSGAISIVDMAEDAVALLDVLGLESAHIMGISMGGMIAQEVALRHPSRVRTLTLGCTYAGGEGSALSGADVMHRLGEAMLSGDRERAIRTGWEVNVSEEWAADEEHFQPFHDIAQRLPVALEVIQAQMAAIGEHDTSERLAEISAPTLVIHGTADQMLPASNATMLATRIPGSRLELLEGVGHLFFWERPELSARLVTEHASGALAPTQ